MKATKNARRILSCMLCATIALTSLIFSSNASDSSLAGDSDVFLGDVNGDSRLTFDDYTVMARYIAGDKSYTPIQKNSDLDSDGSITTNDLRLLLKYLVQGSVEIGDPTFIVSKIDAAPGDASVEVSVSVKNNPGILGMTLSVGYDDSAMTLVGASNGEALSKLNMSKPKRFKNGCNFVWYGEDLEETDIVDGKVLNLVFDISEGAKAGTYPISISYNAGEIFDVDLGELQLDIINGSCTVTSDGGQGSDDDTEQITEPTFTVEKVTANAGDTSIEAAVSVVNNPGILGMTLKVNYDSSVMTLQSASNGEALSMITLTKPKKYKDGCKFVWYGEDIKDSDIVDGEILTLVFDIAADAPAGVYPVSVSYEAGEIFDAGLGELQLDIINGSITIAG